LSKFKFDCASRQHLLKCSNDLTDFNNYVALT
jgi:hypothetical protein